MKKINNDNLLFLGETDIQSSFLITRIYLCQIFGYYLDVAWNPPR